MEIPQQSKRGQPAFERRAVTNHKHEYIKVKELLSSHMQEKSAIRSANLPVAAEKAGALTL